MKPLFYQSRALADTIADRLNTASKLNVEVTKTPLGYQVAKVGYVKPNPMIGVTVSTDHSGTTGKATKVHGLKTAKGSPVINAQSKTTPSPKDTPIDDMPSLFETISTVDKKAAHKAMLQSKHHTLATLPNPTENEVKVTLPLLNLSNQYLSVKHPVHGKIITSKASIKAFAIENYPLSTVCHIVVSKTHAKKKGFLD